MKIERKDIDRHAAELERKIPEVVGTSVYGEQDLLENLGENEKPGEKYEYFPYILPVHTYIVIFTGGPKI